MRDVSPGSAQNFHLVHGQVNAMSKHDVRCRKPNFVEVFDVGPARLAFDDLNLVLVLRRMSVHQYAALASNLHNINWQAFAIGVLTFGIFYGWPVVTRRVPASIVAVAVATLVASVAVPPPVAPAASAREAGAPGASSSAAPGRLRRPNDVFRKPGF